MKLKNFLVSMTGQTYADDMLETLYQSSEPNTPLVHAVWRGIMTNEYSETSSRLNVKQLLFKPFVLITFINPIL